MRLLILFGAQAVGKMTVGQALEEITPLKLFHNHMTIEPVISLFGTYNGQVVNRLRQVIFEEFAQCDQYGMIFTYAWAFDQQADWDYMAWLTRLFEENGAQVDYCELVAPQSVRLLRNQTENRLRAKASKRDVAHSESLILQLEQQYRCVSNPGEIPYPRYFRLDNTDLSPHQAAELIARRFDYPSRR